MKTKNGSNYLLEIDTTTDVDANTRGTEANFKLLACLTANGFDGQRATQTTTNKCSGDYETSNPSTLSWSFPIEGQVVSKDVGEDILTAADLKELFKDGEIFFARIANAANDPDNYDEGKVWISALSTQNPTNDVVTFSGTLTGTGEIFFAPVPVGP